MPEHRKILGHLLLVGQRGVVAQITPAVTAELNPLHVHYVDEVPLNVGQSIPSRRIESPKCGRRTSSRRSSRSKLWRMGTAAPLTIWNKSPLPGYSSRLSASLLNVDLTHPFLLPNNLDLMA
jgi:hypothetical protein